MAGIEKEKIMNKLDAGTVFSRLINILYSLFKSIRNIHYARNRISALIMNDYTCIFYF